VVTVLHAKQQVPITSESQSQRSQASSPGRRLDITENPRGAAEAETLSFGEYADKWIEHRNIKPDLCQPDLSARPKLARRPESARRGTLWLPVGQAR
jgi:hypothetical protein